MNEHPGSKSSTPSASPPPPPTPDAALLDDIREFDQAGLKTTETAVQTDPVIVDDATGQTESENQVRVRFDLPENDTQTQVLSGWADLRAPAVGVVSALAVYGACQIYENYGGAGLATAAAVTGAGCHFLRNKVLATRADSVAPADEQGNTVGRDRSPTMS